jgi:hypothetical protein
MTPSIQQRMAELRIQQLHAEAAHARLVKEARAARRTQQGPSRIARFAASFRGARAEQRPAGAVVSRGIPARRAATKPIGC